MRSNPQVQFMPQPQLGDVVVVVGSSITNIFPRHVHESTCLGIVDRGARRITIRGTETVIPGRQLFVLNPGEPHTCGSAAETGHSYRVIAIGSGLMRSIVSQISGQGSSLPYFSGIRIDDKHLIALFKSFFLTLKPPASLLEQQSRLLDLLSYLILSEANDPPAIKTERQSVRHVQEMMRADYANRLTLEDLAANSGLSPYHFQRLFTHETGISPHDYLEQIRIKKAQEILLEGGSLADTALAVGFVDQSHFTRTFKQVIGIPPGKYIRLHLVRA